MAGLDKNHSATVIIPAAGFGRRVGSPEAKEMLLDEGGQPLIEFSLRCAEQIGAKIVIVTRPEKKTLLSYLETHSYFKNNGKILFVIETSEWPESIIRSKELWTSKNLLILPDTRWSPIGITKALLDGLNNSDVCYASHSVDDLATWGAFYKEGDSYFVAEKTLSGEGVAWGLIAFKESVGLEVFGKQLESTLEKKNKPLMPMKVSDIKLDSFCDVTR